MDDLKPGDRVKLTNVDEQESIQNQLLTTPDNWDGTVTHISPESELVWVEFDALAVTIPGLRPTDLELLG